MQEALLEYGMLGMFLVVMLEYACFPLPSEVVLPLTGALAAQGGMQLWLALILSVTAGLCGSGICYAIGWFGGYPLVNKLCGRFPSMQKGVHASSQKFSKYSSLFVCVGRVIPLCRTYLSFVAGIARQNPAKFFGFSALGILMWNTLLLTLGYLLGDNWEMVMEYYKEYSVIVWVAVGIAAAALAARYLIKRKKEKQEK